MEVDHREEVEVDPPIKRRRISIPRNDGQPYLSLFAGAHKRRESNSLKPSAVIDNCDDEKSNISFSATPKQAGQTVAPFLAKHIPAQYPPAGQVEYSSADSRTDSNTKYCYRHRPDLKCRRQANEPSMEQLQSELQDLSQVDQQAIAHTWSIFSASPAKQRNLILQGILTQCCFPQLSYLSANVRELIRLDFLAALPPEVSFRVLCFLDTASLCRAAQVSQKWRTLADDDVVWHRMCEQHIDRKCLKCGWGLPLLERKRLRASKRQIQLRATGRGLNEWSPNITPLAEQRNAPSIIPASAIAQLKVNDPLASPRRVLTPNTGPSDPSAPPHDESYFGLRTRPWKDVYKDRFKVGTNWKYGRFNTKVFRGHQNGVMCLQFDEHILATGSYDTTIKIWDIQIGEEIRTLRGHTSAVRCLQFDESKLISGSLDHQVRVWNWRTGQCVSTLSGHIAGILGLHFDSSILATASVDHTVRIWDFDDKSASVLRGHSDWVNSVKIDSASRTVFTASDDSLIKLWDLDSKTCIKSFEGHVGQVQQICPLPHDFEFDDRMDGVESHDGGECTSSNASQATSPAPAEQPVAEPYGPGFTTCDRPLPPRYILTAALDSTIRLWDTYTGKSLRTYFGHVEGVWTIAADPLRVVSGSQDRTVKVWDTRGKCERTFTGHSGPVTCIGLSDSRLVSGGEDSEVRMYSF